MESYIEDDKLIREQPVEWVNLIDCLGEIVKNETVITKEEFLMCYKEWVEKPQMHRNASRVKR